MLLKCLGNEVFLMIGEQILKDGRNYLYGMPDLIVWDAIKLKVLLMSNHILYFLIIIFCNFFD